MAGGLCDFSEVDPRTGLDWPGHGVFCPLGPEIGVLGFAYKAGLHRQAFRPRDFSERLTLNRGHTARLNLRTWEAAERFLIAHPDDLAALAHVDDSPRIQPNTAAPYQFRGHGFFGD